ncbi:alpha/beta hydrolase [Devosia sp. J2-20]|jgi:lysophospholipase|uniref:Alpha/beta hydrolase n=1 Tax=Devosia litorisediminis TaxID=2829817 RepID=A0A942E392_9HYPH|nr:MULTISPECIES: alpha/beta hydrolase [Devosia]MBS3847145.1 alpha/beta hydrolase [Devosia litorisediminis]MCZ4346518.1 alpha/beta hydrolase [Devosia neptuniae]WDQ99726.1 alpha/beta hydrolase [Devosia sp. J2-20]|tara:strand:- start:9 stop:980 length:972 start_codon:yes stop_codon:yes gene_type:complete
MNVVDPNGPSLVNIASNPMPEGARVGYFKTPDNVQLRYAFWPKSEGKHRGTICLVQGRAEFIEKYFETIADFRKRGFSVATFDWRGQGGSDRLIDNPALGYVDRFEDYWTDLKSFHGHILLPECPPPYYLVGHSMGGLASLMAGARDRLMFDRIFLSAPMLALDGLPLSMAGMARVAEVLSFVGLGRMPVSRKADKPASEATFPNNPLTGDMLRYLRMVDVLNARPMLEIGAPTVRWAASAFGAMTVAGGDSFPASVRIPLLMLGAARDAVVSTNAIEQLGLRMRTGRHMVIPGARHELFMESDAIRGQVFAAFDAFITEQSG